MSATAFVSHSDCARHDTGWKHPEHQGRLPALVRAVYRDMLTLHDHLVEVEGRPASEEDLLLIHTPAHLARIRDTAQRAGAAGEPEVLEGEVVVSGASWDAVLAAAGTVITGVDTVLDGGARNAFCAVRPPGYAAGAEAVGGFSLVNAAAIGALHLRRRRGVGRVLVVEWGGTAPRRTPGLLAADAGIRVLTVAEAGAGAVESDHSVTLPAGSGGDLFIGAFTAALAEALETFTPDFILLSAGFDILAGDPLGSLSLEPREVHALTALLRDRAEEVCGGRLVSVLEGGYDPSSLGRAVVQHVRALAGLPPV